MSRKGKWSNIRYKKRHLKSTLKEVYKDDKEFIYDTRGKKIYL